MANKPTNIIHRRSNLVLFCLTALGFGLLIGRLYYLQVVQGDMWKEKAMSQQLYSTAINANRGSIYDTNMKTLAHSATVWTVFISPAEMREEQAELVAKGLSEILEVDYDMIIEKSKKTWRYNETIKTKVKKNKADEVNLFVLENKIKGVYMSEDTMRYYPYDTLASTVMGFTGRENAGAYGLESYYNNILAGTPGMEVSARNAKGTAMPFSYQEMYEAKDGNSIVLTVDETVQHFLEKHLENAVLEHEVKERAVGIVMNVKTGEILAMSTKPDFNPNEYSAILDTATAEALARQKAAIETEQDEQEYLAALADAQYAQWRNKAVSDPYEPGSVFKLITAAMALETHTVTPSTPFFCPGYHVVAGNRISCWKNGGHGAIDFAGAVKGSCNPAFILTGQALGGENFIKYLDMFGLYDISGVDMPGEASSIMHAQSLILDPNMASLSSASFGQTFKVTPIQLMTAVNATINGGYLMQPYIVKQVIDSNGNVLSTSEPIVKRQVISEETSRTVAMLAEKVVGETGGSGIRAAVPGYRIGGKTGTSQKLDTADENDHILSFYGFAPADDPEIGVLVMLDNPQKNNQYGSVIAAPVVGSILADVLPYLGYEPHFTEDELSTADVATPYLIGSGVQDAQTQLIQKGLTGRVIGNGTEVTAQVPGAAMPIPGGGTVILYTDSEAEAQTAAVPDVIGKTGQLANKLIINAGFNIKMAGESIEHDGCIAVDQNPPAGEELPIGSVVTITFAVSEVIPD